MPKYQAIQMTFVVVADDGDGAMKVVGDLFSENSPDFIGILTFDTFPVGDEAAAVAARNEAGAQAEMAKQEEALNGQSFQ